MFFPLSISLFTEDLRFPFRGAEKGNKNLLLLNRGNAEERRLAVEL